MTAARVVKPTKPPGIEPGHPTDQVGVLPLHQSAAPRSRSFDGSHATVSEFRARKTASGNSEKYRTGGRL